MRESAGYTNTTETLLLTTRSMLTSYGRRNHIEDLPNTALLKGGINKFGRDNKGNDEIEVNIREIFYFVSKIMHLHFPLNFAPAVVIMVDLLIDAGNMVLFITL